MKKNYSSLLLIAITIILALCMGGCGLISSLFGDKGSAEYDKQFATAVEYMEEYEPEDIMIGLDQNEFKSFKPNEFKNVLNSPFSTFGADVDTASYSILRYYLQVRKTVPSNQHLRTEDMIILSRKRGNHFRLQPSL